MVVAQNSIRPTGVRIQKPMADQVTIADVPTNQPIFQFKSEAVEISDLENGGQQKERQDPEVNSKL